MQDISSEVLPGSILGRWRVIEEAPRRYPPSKPLGQRYWRCRCECGVEREIFHGNLVGGKTTSCGCYLREWASESARTHGKTDTPEYNIWKLMLRRCRAPQAVNYARYGGRGIRVCDRWSGPNGFANFSADVGDRPGPEYSLDRIDNDGDYEPGNVRWSEATVQARNRRSNHPISFDGRTQSLTAWSAERGIGPGTLWFRITHGWSVERALTTPARAIRRH